MKTFLIRNNEGLAMARMLTSEIDWIVENYPLPIFCIIDSTKKYNNFKNGRLISSDTEDISRSRLYYTHDLTNITDDLIFNIKDLSNVVYGYWYDFDKRLMEVVIDNGVLHH